MDGSASASVQATYDPEQSMSGNENRQLLKEEPEQTCFNRCKSCWLSFLRCCQDCFRNFLSCCRSFLRCCPSPPDPSCEQVITPVEAQPKTTARSRVCSGVGAGEQSSQPPGRPPHSTSPAGLQPDRQPGQPESPHRLPKTAQGQGASEGGPKWQAPDPHKGRELSIRRKSADFIIRVRIAGKTGGCEQKFLKDVSKRLQGVSLMVKEFTETSSKDPLLVFCPIASRIGTDMDNALEGLGGDQKAILVVMHLISPDNTETFLDTSRQGTHPALVLTVHTRYTLQGSFYPCEMNKKAVASVAAAIKGLAEDH